MHLLIDFVKPLEFSPVLLFAFIMKKKELKEISAKNNICLFYKIQLTIQLANTIYFEETISIFYERRFPSNKTLYKEKYLLRLR